MKEISVKIEGISPILQHKFLERQEEESKKKKKIYEDNAELEKSLYRNSEGKLIQPATHIKASMVKAASNFKFEGKKTYKDIMKSNIIIDPLEIVHLNQKYEMDKRGVVIGRVRIMRVRGLLKNWALKFKILCNDEDGRISTKILREILEDAGKTVGIGDNRPENGRFKVVEFKEES